MNVADRLLPSPVAEAGTPPTRRAFYLRPTAGTRANIKISPRGRSRLVSVMAPELAKLIRSNDITSNIYAEEYAEKLAAKMIDTAVARFDA